MPGTIVEPPASMTWTSGGRVPSSLLERIQTTWPASTRTLTSFRRDGPLGSARAASRYKVGRETIIEAPGVSSDSTSTFKDCLAEPDERRVRLEPLRLREERPEPRVAVVLLMGLVIRGDDVKEVIRDAASLLASATRTDETGLEEPTPARKVVPDRDLLGLEHRFEVRCVIGGDSEDDRRGLGRDAFRFPRHASTMLERLLKSKAASNSGRNRYRRGRGTTRQALAAVAWVFQDVFGPGRLTLEGRATVLDGQRSLGVRGGSFFEQLPRRMGESPVGGECKRPAGGEPTYADFGELGHARPVRPEEHVDRRLHLVHDPGDGFQVHQPGGVHDVRSAASERLQPGNRVVEVLDPIEVVLGSGGEHDPVRVRRLDRGLDTEGRDLDRVNAVGRIVVFDRHPGRALLREARDRSLDSRKVVRVAALRVDVEGDLDRSHQGSDMMGNLVDRDVLVHPTERGGKPGTRRGDGREPKRGEDPRRSDIPCVGHQEGSRRVQIGEPPAKQGSLAGRVGHLRSLTTARPWSRRRSG